MYDPQQVLQNIDDNVALVLALGGVALVCNYIFFGEAIRGALRDRFGRDELAPQLSRRNFRLYVLGAVALGIVFWKVGKDAFADDLYLATFMITVVWGLISGYGLLISRGGRRGQSPLQWAAYAGMAASYGALSIIVFGGAFDDFPWVALCVAGVAGGAALAWLLSRARDYDRPTSDAGPLGEALLRAEAR